MPKYWVKNYFAHGRFSEVGKKQKTEKKKEREKNARIRCMRQCSNVVFENLGHTNKQTN